MLGIRLMDPSGSIVTGDPVTIEPTASLRAAARQLGDEWVGALLVQDHRGILGIVSERDVVRAMADGDDPDATRVDHVMTDDVASIAEGQPIAEAAEAMADNEIRHLVVLDDEEQPAGIISLRDIIAVLLEELRSEDPTPVP
jgi:CBS domain-containing protein